MKTKRTFFSEAAYVVGVLLLAFGTALTERADFGMSMVVAPAYLLHLKISAYWEAFTFGMAEYALQAFLLVVLSIFMRRGKFGYLFSFVTAIFYGTVLDLSMRAVAILPGDGIPGRLAFYLSGLLLCACGVAFLFHTYISPEAYELFVKEISSRYGFSLNKVKTIYDCISCLAGILLSFCFFGFLHFEGVKLGTVFCALVNGWLIGRIGRGLEAVFTFRDALPLRRFFEK